MKAMGAPKSAIQDAAGEDEFNLFEENEVSWLVFQDCRTQWRVALNGITGLDYVAVDVMLKRVRDQGKRLGRRVRDRVFAEVRDYERGALKALSERG